MKRNKTVVSALKDWIALCTRKADRDVYLIDTVNTTYMQHHSEDMWVLTIAYVATFASLHANRNSVINRIKRSFERAHYAVFVLTTKMANSIYKDVLFNVKMIHITVTSYWSLFETNWSLFKSSSTLFKTSWTLL